jgi:hypothetical protein
VPTLGQVPYVKLVAILAVKQYVRNDAILYHVGCAPLATDHGVVTQVPPEIVGKVLVSPVFLPLALDLKILVVHQEYTTRPVSVRGAQSIDIDGVGATMDGVRPAVFGLAEDLFWLNGLHNPGVAWVRLGIDDIDS